MIFFSFHMLNYRVCTPCFSKPVGQKFTVSLEKFRIKIKIIQLLFEKGDLQLNEKTRNHKREEERKNVLPLVL